MDKIELRCRMINKRRWQRKKKRKVAKAQRRRNR